jgi:tetratricopeptide (TPR) repeat protein
MPVELIVPCVHEALGESVIYEESKGNFAQAECVAEEAFCEAQRTAITEQVADAWLARSVVQLLRGKPRGALACLEELERLVPGDTARQLRAISYANLATYLCFTASCDDIATAGIMGR